MVDIYELASKGTLIQADLDKTDLKDIDELDKSCNLSALGIAVWNGHSRTVELLLENGGNANLREGEFSRPPLWLAAAKTKVNAASIVRLLLKHGADPNLRRLMLNKLEGTSPLEEAVELGDFPTVISLLVDGGAKPDDKLNNNETAQQKANKKGNKQLIRALKPQAERTQTKGEGVAMLMSLLLGVIFLVNTNGWVKVAAGTGSAGLAYVTRNRVAEYFQLEGVLDDRLPRSLREAKDASRFREDMKDFIKKNDFEKFFPEGSEFLSRVVDALVRLDRDPEMAADTRDLARLALYQPALYCDDSGSMNDDRKKQLKSIVKRIASITTKIVPTGGGIELRFINAKTTDEMSKPNVTKVDEIIDSARFRGETPIGTRLKQKVLEDLVYAPLREDRLNRPILVSIITDGEPTPEKPDYIQKVISECVRELDKKEYTKNVIKFQISQIGDDADARKFIKSLNNESNDVLYCTTQSLDKDFARLRDNDTNLEAWLVGLLMSPILAAGNYH